MYIYRYIYICQAVQEPCCTDTSRAFAKSGSAVSCFVFQRAQGREDAHRQYRGTSLIRDRRPLGPYCRTISRAL